MLEQLLSVAAEAAHHARRQLLWNDGGRGGFSALEEGFEDMYPAEAFPGPCWAMLGNHDYDEENFHKVAAELSYPDAHPQTRWKMPAKWYRVDYL